MLLLRRRTTGSPGQLARALRRATATALTCVVLIAAGLVAAGYLLGCRTLLVRSGSMGEVAPVGSIVLMRPVDAADVGLGDVLLLEPPSQDVHSPPVLHRVIERVERDGRVVVRTKGDLNTAADPGVHVVREGSLVLAAAVPKAGYGVAVLRNRWVWWLFVVLPLSLVAVRSLWRSWHPGRRPE